MIAVKRHPSRKDAYADGKLALHPALQKDPWMYFNDDEYTRTDDGLVVPLKPETKPRLLHKPLYPNDPAIEKGNNE